MGWMTRYGKRQDDFAPSPPNPVRFRHILIGVLFFFVLCACVAFFPLTVIFMPQPQLNDYMPKGVHCATCKEIWEHNRDLFNREDMLCYGPPAYDRPTRKNEEVMFSEEKRCWVLEEEHDTWMRPLQVTDKEIEAQAIILRGGHWP